jgi:PAS domain S-box-containing protein
MEKRQKIRVLFVEDFEDDYVLVGLKLRESGLELLSRRVESRNDLILALTEQSWDIVISDFTLPDLDAFAVLMIVKDFDPDLPVLIISGAIGEETAVAAMRAGAGDYLMKGNLTRLGAAVEREIEESCVKRERRSIQKALEESERRFRDLADAMPQIVWTAGPDGSVEYVNQRWKDYTGDALPGTFSGDWGIQRFHPDDRTTTMKAWEEATRKGGRYQNENRIRAKDGSWRWHLSRAEPVKGLDGKIEKWYGTATDIDDQKQLETKLRDMNKMKDEFLATLSHELRTPLNSIIGHSELLEFEEPGTPDFQESLEAIKRNAHVQNQLIADLLDVSRIISGKLYLDIQIVELGPLIDAAVASQRFAADAKGVRLSSEIEPGVGPVKADAARLQQVLWNLISNAVKFTSKGGIVTVVLKRSNSKIQIDVKDSGIGIAPDFLPYVFERFRQEDASMSRNHGGLGLGLAIVRHLVELHGGTVHAESEGKDRGATFRVCLPPLAILESESQDSDVPGQSYESGSLKANQAWGKIVLKGHRILVVDDHDDARNMVAKILQRAGAEVDAAESVEEAMKLLFHRHYSLAICDLGMPREDGFAFIKAVRSNEGRMSLMPAIALTAYASEEDQRRTERSGFQQHLSKPVTPMLLLRSVCQLIGC